MQTEEGKSSSDSSDDSSTTEASKSTKKRKVVDTLEGEREEAYVIVYNRIDRGKLHRSGEMGCWMARKRKFKRAAEFQELPPRESYTSRCRVCWPSLKEDEEMSSDSEDELDESALGKQPKSYPEDGVYRRRRTESERLWS